MRNLSNKELIYGIEKTLEIPKPIATFLVNRDITNEEQILKLLKKDFNLSNPFLIPEFKKATERIIFSIKNDEKIIIFGDYDVDGMLASAILFLYLKKLNANVDIHLPDRIKDGYGFSKEQITKLKDLHNVNLIISVDTGSNAIEEAKFIKELGIDLIITDHHELNNVVKPECFAFVNPKTLKTDENGLKNLCGAGLAFYLVRGINSLFFNKGKRLNVTNYLVLSMIATVADMVPLIGDNRLIVDKGLELLYQTDILGLQYLLEEVFKYDYPSAQDIAYNLVPIINSAGRMNQSEKIIELLSENNLSVSQKVKDLIDLNKERRTLLEKDLFKISDIKLNSNYNFIYKEDLFFGTIGIIANKLLNENNNATLVLTKVENKIKGSGRSSNLNLKKFLDENTNLFEKAGGHAFAIGFTLAENITEKQLEESFDSWQKSQKNEIVELNVDYELTVSEVTEKFNKILYLMEPFGQSFISPVVCLKNIEKFDDLRLYKKEHMKLTINDKLEVLHFFTNENDYEKFKTALLNHKRYQIYGKIHSTGQKSIILVQKINFE